MKVLNDLVVDTRRRKECACCDELDAMPAAPPRTQLNLHPSMLSTLERLFSGKIQRAILRGLVLGETIAAVAERMGVDAKEAHRVASEMGKRLGSAS